MSGLCWLTSTFGAGWLRRSCCPTFVGRISSVFSDSFFAHLYSSTTMLWLVRIHIMLLKLWLPAIKQLSSMTVAINFITSWAPVLASSAETQRTNRNSTLIRHKFWTKRRHHSRPRKNVWPIPVPGVTTPEHACWKPEILLVELIHVTQWSSTTHSIFANRVPTLKIFTAWTSWRFTSRRITLVSQITKATSH